MRDILTSHPGVAMLPFETHLLDIWAPRGLDLSDPQGFLTFWSGLSAQPGFGRLGRNADELRDELLADSPLDLQKVLIYLMASFAARQRKPRGGEKTPNHFRHLDVFFDWYPDAQVVFMVRDPRSVLASWTRRDARWSRRPAYEIVDLWRSSIEHADHWSSDPRVRIVRFEDLVADPVAETRALHGFLGLGVSAVESSRSGSRPATSRAEDLVEARPSSGWRTILTASQLALVESVAGREMERYGYQPAAPLAVRERVRSAAYSAVLPLRRVLRATKRLVVPPPYPPLGSSEP